MNDGPKSAVPFHAAAPVAPLSHNSYNTYNRSFSTQSSREKGLAHTHGWLSSLPFEVPVDAPSKARGSRTPGQTRFFLNQGAQMTFRASTQT